MFHVVLGWYGQWQTIRHNRTMPALRAQFGTSAILGTVNRSKKTGTSRIISFSSDAKSILVGMALVLIGGAMWGCNATVSKLLMSNYSVDPLWLACITNGISVGIGELISCTVLGVLLVKIVETNTSLRKVFLEA